MKVLLDDFLKWNRYLKSVHPLCSEYEVVKYISQKEHHVEIVSREYLLI